MSFELQLTVFTLSSNSLELGIRVIRLEEKDVELITRLEELQLGDLILLPECLNLRRRLLQLEALRLLDVPLDTLNPIDAVLS